MSRREDRFDETPVPGSEAVVYETVSINYEQVQAFLKRTDPASVRPDPPPPVVPALPRRTPVEPLRPLSDRALAAARAASLPGTPDWVLSVTAEALAPHLDGMAKDSGRAWRSLVERLYEAVAPCHRLVWSGSSGCNRASTRMTWDDGSETYACDDHATDFSTSIDTPWAAAIRDAEAALRAASKAGG